MTPRFLLSAFGLPQTALADAEKDTAAAAAAAAAGKPGAGGSAAVKLGAGSAAAARLGGRVKALLAMRAAYVRTTQAVREGGTVVLRSAGPSSPSIDDSIDDSGESNLGGERQ